MKYYYTDPLAAAWMAKHFGMKFEYDATSEGMLRVLPVDLAAACMPNAKLFRYSIHPDSLHLLDNLPEAKKSALKELGMWPEVEE